MSETTKPVETAKKAADQVARSSQASIDAAGKAAKEVASEASGLAQASADGSKEMAKTLTETATETAHAATDMSTKAAEQSRDVLLLGVRTAAGVGSRVAEIGFGRGHHFMSSAAQVMDMYRDASERSSERVQALFSSAFAVSRGLQNMQHAWFEMLDHTMEHASHKPQDLLRCKNATEVAEMQRDLYLEAINHAFESTNRLLDLTGRTAQDAVRPLRS
jgi:hypothetical protein